jgi:D-glycero-D-manno-heptose 1,7-bisphosphate phosphatase
MISYVRRTSHFPSIVSTVFPDRDGVINRKMPEGEYVRSSADFEILSGVAESIGKLNQAGISVIVVSNQRGVALGYYTTKDVETVHETLQKVLNENRARGRILFLPT